MSGAFRVVIPSRYGASRLPGKPLRLIAGRPMIEHVVRRGRESGAASVVVATDDERIEKAVQAFGGEAWMTSPDHASGTDRLAEVAARAGWPDDTVVVNLQGDEPCMPASAIRRVAALLDERPEAGVATCATPIREPAELFDPSVVKVVVDDGGLARWFSRAPIPWVRDRFAPGVVPTAIVHAVSEDGLGAAPSHAHERAESLEQLRALCVGIGIAVAILAEAPGPGVDTEADLARAEAVLAAGEGWSA